MVTLYLSHSSVLTSLPIFSDMKAAVCGRPTVGDALNAYMAYYCYDDTWRVPGGCLKRNLPSSCQYDSATFYTAPIAACRSIETSKYHSAVPAYNINAFVYGTIQP